MNMSRARYTILVLLAIMYNNYGFWLLQGDLIFVIKKVIPNLLYIFHFLMSLAVSNEEWKQIEIFKHYKTAADFLLDVGKPSLFLINR